MCDMKMTSVSGHLLNYEFEENIDVTDKYDQLINDLFHNELDNDNKEEQSPASGLGITPEIYNTPVETLDLSARTLNCLKRAGINRVGEVVAMPEPDLLKIRNFGRKSLNELFDILAERNMLPNK